MFSEQEIEYLNSQRLARIATVSAEMQPDVAAVGYEFDGRFFYIGGREQKRTLKHKNVASGNAKVAIVIDDLETGDQWKPRGIKIHGTAEIVEREGRLGIAPYLKVTPVKYWSWGIERPVFEDGQITMKKGIKV
jgi:pyridoxamine 5'-phosphate oxidase family protein